MTQLGDNDYPIFEDEHTVYLLWQGEADTVAIIGDMSDWDESVFMNRIEGTNLFYYHGQFEANARLDYWLRADTMPHPMVDLRNPFKDLSGYGESSELAMPEYIQHPLLSDFRSGRKGDFNDLGKQEIAAGALPHPHEIFIYLPPNYQVDERQYPAAYFQDAKDYIEFAMAPHILNQLIKAGKIAPLIGVFVNPPNLHQPKIPNRSTEYGMNEDYVHFFTQELVPFIDENFRTLRNSKSRLVIGDSYGGLISLCIAFRHPDIFGNVYSQSGYLSFSNDSMIKEIEAAPVAPLDIYFDIGIYERKVGAAFLPEEETDFLMANRRFKQVLQHKGYDFIYFEYPEGHT